MFSFQVLKQKILHLPFRLQAREHDRIKRALCHNVTDIDRPRVSRLILPCRAYALNDLQILLEIPPLVKNDEDMPAVLLIEAMSGGRGIGYQHRDLAAVPCGYRLRILVEEPRGFEAG